MWRGIGLSLLLLLSFASVSSAVVSNIAGINVSGPKPNLPLTISINCNGACPNHIAPSYTDAERLWGGTTVCQTSIDRGATWNNCAGALPVTFSSIAQVAETVNGTVVVAGRPLSDIPSSCVIYRSVDSGATWTLVHSDANFCTFAGGEADTNHMWCAADGTCALVFRNTTTSAGSILTSNDDGLTWALTTIAVVGGINTVAYDGVVGGGFGITGAFAFSRFSSNVWSTVTPVGSRECWGSYIQGGTSFASCQTGIQAETLNEQTGLVNQVWTLPNAFYGAGIGILSVNYNDTALYVVAADPVNENLVYVSTDGGITFVQIYNFLSLARRGGTAFVHPANGCVYFSRTLSRVIGICL